MRYLLVCLLSVILKLSFCQSLDSLKDVMHSSSGNSRAIISKDIANRYLRKNEYDSAEKYYNTAIEISRNTKNHELLGKCLNNKGVSKYLRGDVKEGVVLYQEALEQYRILGNDTLTSQSLTNLGLTFKRLNIYDKSLECLYESAFVQENLGLKKELSSNWNAIGNIHRIIKNYELSLEYLTKALSLRREIDYEVGIAQSYQNLGTWYLEVDSIHEALERFHKANRLKKAIGSPKLLASTLSSLGRAYSKLGELDSAEYYFQFSLRLREGISDNSGISTVANHLAELKIKVGKLDSVLHYLEIARRNAISSGQKEQLSIAYGGLAEYYILNEEYQEAVTFFERQINLKEEILDIEKAKALTEAEIRYEVDRKEEEIRERDESLIHLKKRTTLLSVVILALLISSIIVLRFYILSRKLSQERKSSHERVTKLLNELNHRTKNHLQSQVALVKMQGRYLPDGIAKNEIKEVENRMRAITLIHQSLYDASESSIADINLSEYLKNLIENLMISFKYTRNKINMVYKIAPVDTELRYSLPIGLIVNEAVTNAFKYAFKVEAPKLEVELISENGCLILTIQDNGPGFDLNEDLKMKSFGLSTMYDLAGQLNGELRVEKNMGTLISLKVPMIKR